MVSPSRYDQIFLRLEFLLIWGIESTRYGRWIMPGTGQQSDTNYYCVDLSGRRLSQFLVEKNSPSLAGLPIVKIYIATKILQLHRRPYTLQALFHVIKSHWNSTAGKKLITSQRVIIPCFKSICFFSLIYFTLAVLCCLILMYFSWFVCQIRKLWSHTFIVSLIPRNWDYQNFAC